MGVIMYTLLVGKPPYEAKDVKSTYKRIIANVYSFPDHVQVSDRAKDLIMSMLQSKPELRPTLDQVQNHSFFTHADAKIPLSLPQSSTVEAPRWRINSKGEIVVDTTVKVHKDSTDSKRRAPLRETTNSNAAGGTLAAAGKGGAAEGAQNDKENKAPGFEPRTTRSRAKAAAAAQNEGKEKETKKTSKWAFKIYDDYVNGKDGKKSEDKKKSADADVEELTAKTAAFTLSGTNANTVSGSTSTASSRRSSAGSTIDNDMFALETMHQRLSQSFKSGVVPPSSPVTPDSAAKKWVTRYVDYTSKYGLGFLLNDGSAGVYFNDSTKVVLGSDGEVFDYVERKRTEGDKRGDHVRETHTLTNYPTSQQKKVILLKHFRNYLVEQHKRSEEKGEVIEVGGVVTDEEKARAASDTGDLVYLKKWVRTRHAILFRLSNRTVQVVFFDHTEVLLSCEARSVTYVDKERRRETHALADVMGGGGRADIAKRLKYTKDILHQLITGAKR